jgi:broad specificity phosphatase PhoE
MTGALDTCGWGKPAQALLLSCGEMDPERPAALVIRHTERFPVMGGMANHAAACTPRGMEAATSFGEGLPARRVRRIYTTRIDRSRETAEAIIRGVEARGGRAEIDGQFPARTTLDQEGAERYMGEVMRQKGDEVQATILITYRWFAGLTPPGYFRPSLEFARVNAAFVAGNLATAFPGSIDVYVSHDTYVGAFMFHWFAEPLYPGGVGFLDGFLMQPAERSIDVWLRDRHVSVEYPWWWRAGG